MPTKSGEPQSGWSGEPQNGCCGCITFILAIIGLLYLVGCLPR